MNSEDRGKIVEYFHELETRLPTSSRLDGNFTYNMLKSFIYVLPLYGLIQIYCIHLETVYYLSCLFLGFVLLMYLIYKPVFQYRYFMSKRFMAKSGIIQILIVSNSKEIVADRELIPIIIKPLSRVIVSGMDGIDTPYYLNELFISTLATRSNYDANTIYIQNDAIKKIFRHIIMRRQIIRGNHFKMHDKLFYNMMDYLFTSDSLDLLHTIDQCRVTIRKFKIYKLLNQSNTFTASEIIDKFDQLSNYLLDVRQNDDKRVRSTSEHLGISSKQ